jgi:hypothetical protein
VKYGIILNTSSGQYLSSVNTVEIRNDLIYGNDIAIIGKDESSSLNQKQSKSTNDDAILTIALGATIELPNTANTNNFDEDLDFFVWGNNYMDTVISEVLFPKVIDEVSPYDYIGFDRDWKVKNTGIVSGVTLQFDLFGFASPGDFDLLVDEDYSDGVQRIYETGTLTGTNLTFSNHNINNGEVFTFFRKNPEAQITYELGSWTVGNSAGILDNSTTDLLKSVVIKSNVIKPTSSNCRCLEVVSGVEVTVENSENLLVSDVLNIEGAIYLFGGA